MFLGFGVWVSDLGDKPSLQRACVGGAWWRVLLLDLCGSGLWVVGAKRGKAFLRQYADTMRSLQTLFPWMTSEGGDEYPASFVEWARQNGIPLKSLDAWREQ